jgi:hypothetical protein
VIDGRYAADLPDFGRTNANELLLAAHRVVDAVEASQPNLKASVRDSKSAEAQAGPFE